MIRLALLLTSFVAYVPFAGADETRRRVANVSSAGVLAANGQNAVLVAAHRGGYADDKRDQAPENSLANLQLAIQKGYDVYETDIQRTADGVFVIVHDPSLDRETDGSGKASDLTLAELKKLKKRYRDRSISNQQVATLEELLVAGKGKILFKPDLKPGIIEHFAELAKLIGRLEMSDQVFLRTQYANTKVVKKCFEDGCPKVEVMFRAKTTEQVRTIVDWFHPKTIQIDLAKNESLSAKKTAAIQAAVNAGVLVETHSYSDPKQWQRLAEAGVRMFHTAQPDATLKYLKSNGWRQGLARSTQ